MRKSQMTKSGTMYHFNPKTGSLGHCIACSSISGVVVCGRDNASVNNIIVPSYQCYYKFIISQIIWIETKSNLEIKKYDNPCGLS